jgi:hypothetical protein
VQAVRVYAFSCFVVFSAACVNGTDCDLVGCERGLSVTFVRPYSDAGTYTITVDIDAVRTTCTVLLPTQKEPGQLCDHDEVGLRVAFPQSILGVGMTSTSAKSVAIRVAKDGAELASGSFAPAYTKSGCADGCLSAKHDFP